MLQVWRVGQLAWIEGLLLRVRKWVVESAGCSPWWVSLAEVVEVALFTAERVELLLVTAVVRMSPPEFAAATVLGLFDLPLFHPLTHLAAGGKAIDVEIRSPEELAEILGALKLHLNVLHVSVEVLDQDCAALVVLL